MGILAIPTEDEKKVLIDRFNSDIESYTITDDSSNLLLPVICCVCDSIPREAQWSTKCEVTKLVKLLSCCNMDRSLFKELYPPLLLNQYTADNNALKPYVLSPSTFVSKDDQVIICKDCLNELEKEQKRKKPAMKRLPPKESIANGYIIGKAPPCLLDLSPTELSLISRVRSYCQSWVFFGGCHQHIKGWHTFFKNRPSDNVGNITMLSESGLKGLILVVLCGPFTSTQKALVLKKINIDPRKVIAAWRWLKANNFRYRNDIIPHIDDIPLAKIIEDNK
jgi:hypothetical protein